MERTIERWYEIQEQQHSGAWLTLYSRRFEYGNDALEHKRAMQRKWPDVPIRVVVVTRSVVAWEGDTP